MYGHHQKARRQKRATAQAQSLQLLRDKTEITYKDATRLRKYVSERGKIFPRRISGNCAKHQRELTTAVKRARVIAFLPFVPIKPGIST